MLKYYFQKQLNKKKARGIIVVDKQADRTSHDEVNILRGIFKTRKVGHSGTLDPKVTGVLVCGLGQGTRVLEYVLLSQKIYDCEIVFHKAVSQKNFEAVMQQFTGVITQLPPQKSSVKRVEREREVYGLELISFADDSRTAHIRCTVERGTYVRKLCHDMGTQLGVGAHMGDLRRIQAGPFTLENSTAVTTTHLRYLKQQSNNWLWGWWYLREIAEYIDPIERVTNVLPWVRVHNQTAPYLGSGADLFAPGVLDIDPQVYTGTTVRVVNQDSIVVMIGQAVADAESIKSMNSGIAVKVQKVLL